MIREVGHDGLVLSVRDEGSRSGEAVLLLHGFPQDGGCWDDVVPALHRAGLRTLAPDQRGYSPGARPDDVCDYRLERLTGDALAVLEACGVERAHVVGHDWGGALAWRLGAQHPARVMSLTVLSTPHPAALARSMGTSLQAVRSWYTLAVQVPVVPEVVLSRTLEPALRASGLAPGPAAPTLAAARGSHRGSRGGARPDHVRVGTPRRCPRRRSGAPHPGVRGRRVPVHRAGCRALASRDAPDGRGRRSARPRPAHLTRVSVDPASPSGDMVTSGLPNGWSVPHPLPRP